MPATTTRQQPVMIGSAHTVDVPTPNPLGRIIIDLISADNGRDHFPVLRCDPVGYFTSGLMERYNLHFCQEIERAQALVRGEEARKQREATASTREAKEHAA